MSEAASDPGSEAAFRQTHQAVVYVREEVRIRGRRWLGLPLSVADSAHDVIACAR